MEKVPESRGAYVSTWNETWERFPTVLKCTDKSTHQKSSDGKDLWRIVHVRGEFSGTPTSVPMKDLSTQAVRGGSKGRNWYIVPWNKILFAWRDF